MTQSAKPEKKNVSQKTIGEIVAEDYRTAMKEPLEKGHNYATWSLSFLADYIVNTHHAYLNKEMGPIALYAHKTADVHGKRHPEVIKIATIFDKIISDMAGHLREEEEVLFPAIKRIEMLRKKNSIPLSEDRDMIKISLENNILFLKAALY